MFKLTFYKLNLYCGSQVELQKTTLAEHLSQERTTRSYRAHQHDLTSSTRHHLKQGLTNPEYSIVLRKTYPMKRKDFKDMLA
jgi:hypothetical protein